MAQTKLGGKIGLRTLISSAQLWDSHQATFPQARPTGQESHGTPKWSREPLSFFLLSFFYYYCSHSLNPGGVAGHLKYFHTALGCVRPHVLHGLLAEEERLLDC